MQQLQGYGSQFIVPMSDKHRRGRDNDLAVVLAISNLNYNNNYYYYGVACSCCM